jgi:Tol biopolymer transport system component
LWIQHPLDLAQHDLVPNNDPYSYDRVIWTPDGKSLIVARSLPSSGSAGPQLYKVDVATGEATPLVIDDEYSHGRIQLSPLGDTLLFLRFRSGKTLINPSLWVYSFATGETKLIADNVYEAQWLP